MLLDILSTLCWVALAAASNDTDFEADPYLQYRPPFARSLPVQILLTGVVLTLVAVLFIHLIFTAQYHWPLAPVNYVLQISGVTTLLISLIATLHVVLSATLDESENWPYMLSYIAVNVPPLDIDENIGWTSAERATWLIMNATTSGLIQITHIQFLTLLYPSRLEGRLIFSLLGPLAVVAAIMQLLPIHESTSVNIIASAVRNVCNASLSLLFTAALFIWGLLVNRGQAWRTDGGTAAFGCAALSLAIVSTGLNFLYVPREEEYVWLPGLMWAVVLWQSFLGWWWWVGAGSGGGMAVVDEAEEMRRREKREKRRKISREKRQETRAKAKMVWRGVTGAFGPRQEHEVRGQVHATGRETRPSDSDADGEPHSSSGSPPSSPSGPTSGSPPSDAASTSSLTSSATLPRFLPGVVHQWYASLRQAHVKAARRQAIERVERIRELEREGVADSGGRGWGLGSIGLRTHHQPRPPRATSLDNEHEHGAEHDLHSRAEGRRRSAVLEAGAAADPPEKDRDRIEDDENSEDGGPASPRVKRERPRSVWWWGPLGRWRLQDSTVY